MGSFGKKRILAVSAILAAALMLMPACAQAPVSGTSAGAASSVSSAAVDTRDFTPEGTFVSGIEGPAFDAQGDLFAVNWKESGTVGRVRPDGSSEQYLKLPGKSVGNSIQFDGLGRMLIADYVGHTVWRVRDRKPVAWVHEPRMNQPNDMAVARGGTIYLSDPDWEHSTGQLWKIDSHGRTTLLEKNMGTTNGIALSPDQKVLYVNESAQLKVWRYDLDPKGTPIHKTLFVEFKDGDLDGMKTDEAGNLYICRHGLGLVSMYSPEGKLVREIHLRGKKGSNLVLHGKQGFVTVQDRGTIEVFDR